MNVHTSVCTYIYVCIIYIYIFIYIYLYLYYPLTLTLYPLLGGSVRCISFSENGYLLGSGADSGGAKIWYVDIYIYIYTYIYIYMYV
jgi:hypothetical protein